MKKYMRALWLPVLAVAALLSALPVLATEESEPLPHTHTVESWTDAENGHSGTCSTCGETVAEAHVFDAGTVTLEPTCQAEGKTLYTCSVCNSTKEEPIPQLPGHVCQDWTEAEPHHTGKCIHCGQAVMQKHIYGEGTVTLAPTCQAEGKISFTCATCNHTNEEVIPMLTGHVGGEWTFDDTQHSGKCIHCGEAVTGEHSYGEGVVTTAPTCQAEGVLTFSCVCGHSYEESISVLAGHTGGEWTFDDAQHNGKCIHCGEAVTGEHSYGEGVVTTAPTCQAEGVLTFTCICGHSYTQAIPQLAEHIYGNYIFDDESHCGQCIHCGHLSGADHTWDEGVVTLEPTCTEDGTQLFTCTACGHTKQEVFPTPGHIYGDWESVDEDYHKHACVCGKTEKKKHTWDKGVVTTKPTCDKYGVKTYTCTGCSETKSVRTYKLQHTYTNSCDVTCNVCSHIRRASHTYKDTWYTDEHNHWHKCTVCREEGEIAEHTPSEWIIDVPAGEETDGSQHKECTVCSYKLETEVIPATGCLHGNEELRDVKDPSCTEEGYTGDLTCPRCFVIVTPGEVIPMLPHNTQVENQKDSTCAEEGYTGDHICQDCGTTVTAGEAIEKLPHNTQLKNQKDPTCAEEGYTGDQICQDCGATVTAGEAIEKLPHETKLQNKKKASCTEEGYTGDLVCENCQSVIEQGQAIAITDHRFEEGLCLDCMAGDPNYVAPSKPNEGVVPDIDFDQDGPPLSPMIIAAIAMLAVTGIGMVVLIILVAKKK